VKVLRSKWSFVSRTVVGPALAVLLFAMCSSIEAQEPTKIPRIGFLIATTPSAISARLDAFRHGLRELGYVEGKGIGIEYRWAEGKINHMPELAAELTRLKVDLIFSTGPQSTRAANKATSTIPIVMGFDNDPVGNGFIASLARPGGNITGFSILSPEISGKRLELLKEIVPGLSRVAVLGTSTIKDHARFLTQHERTAGALRLQLQYLDVLSANDIETSFRAARKGRADGVLVLAGPVLSLYRTRVVDLAAQSRLPAIYNFPEFVDSGGLMTYGVNQNDLARRAATYVDKILKGAKPADLPVEQPTKFEFVLNLKAAKQIGLAIPPSVLVRADRVIK
jgi:putative tryptophan/tyrosine transport system substrate-binding protein